jgi:hypothetical protein
MDSRGVVITVITKGEQSGSHDRSLQLQGVGVSSCPHLGSGLSQQALLLLFLISVPCHKDVTVSPVLPGTQEKERLGVKETDVKWR